MCVCVCVCVCVCTCVLHNLLIYINGSVSMCYSIYCIVCVQSAELKVQSYMRTQDLENYAEHTNSSLLYLTLEALGKSTHVQYHPHTCINLYIPASHICIHCTYVLLCTVCMSIYSRGVTKLLSDLCIHFLLSFQSHIIFYFSSLLYSFSFLLLIVCFSNANVFSLLWLLQECMM